MNYKLILSTIFVFAIAIQMQAQKYYSKTGDISFSSTTPMEDIEAESHTASTVFDLESGKIQWAVLIKSFEFEKALMQEHFNENYMESSKFPKAKFKGKITNITVVDFTKDGTYDVVVEGKLTIHGVSQEVKTKGTITLEGGQVSATSKFDVAVADYGIEIPSVVKENIAKMVSIHVDITNYQSLNQ